MPQPTLGPCGNGASLVPLLASASAAGPESPRLPDDSGAFPAADDDPDCVPLVIGAPVEAPEAGTPPTTPEEMPLDEPPDAKPLAAPDGPPPRLEPALAPLPAVDASCNAPCVEGELSGPDVPHAKSQSARQDQDLKRMVRALLLRRHATNRLRVPRLQYERATHESRVRARRPGSFAGCRQRGRLTLGFRLRTGRHARRPAGTWATRSKA
jgi:hypothetical protein